MTPKEVVLGLYQAYGTRDPAQIAPFLADDVQWVAPPGNATQVALGLGNPEDAGAPDGSNILDKATILDFMANDFARLFSDVAVDITALFEAGDHVILEQRLSATLANGRSYVNDYCFVFRVANGQVTAIREYMDTRGGWAQAFGDAPGGAIVPPRMTA